ncbi:MAG TPA: hypothetical protein VGX91_09365 [Candidatus Cybelea sp.]|nr:hypothetical protein [Candidatus Cybelea sp.]
MPQDARSRPYFGGSGDGIYPQSGLRYFKGVLYGTTERGAADGGGTLLALTP